MVAGKYAENAGAAVSKFTAKAFIDDKPIETPTETYEEASKLYWAYRGMASCDAAYIYEGDRIRESWSESYDRYLASQESRIEDCDNCGAPLTDEDGICPECGVVR